MAAAQADAVAMNQLVLSARLVERGAVRYTPAGLPALDLTLEHQSTVEQDGGSRKVSFEIHALVIGVITARFVSLVVGTQGEFAGFLSARRNGRGLLFHVTDFDPSP